MEDETLNICTVFAISCTDISLIQILQILSTFHDVLVLLGRILAVESVILRLELYFPYLPSYVGR